MSTHPEVGKVNKCQASISPPPTSEKIKCTREVLIIINSLAYSL